MLIFIRNSINKDLSNMVSRGRSNKQIIFSVQFINSFLGAFTTSGAGVMKNFLGAQPWEGARESKVIKPWLSRGKWVVGDNRKSISLCAAGGGVVVLRGRGCHL